jgi:hypothetical protein
VRSGEKMKSVEIIAKNTWNELEKEINYRIKTKNVKDIKFSVGTLYGGTMYYAMIIYE